MINVYAYLLGEWINLNKADKVVIDYSYTDPVEWYEDKYKSLYKEDFITIELNFKLYRITPNNIQVVKE